MGMLDFLTGGVGSELAKGAMDIAKGFFPAKLSEEDEQRLAMQLQALTNNHVKSYSPEGYNGLYGDLLRSTLISNGSLVSGR